MMNNQYTVRRFTNLEERVLVHALLAYRRQCVEAELEAVDSILRDGWEDEEVEAPRGDRFRPAVEHFLDGVADGLGWHDED